MASSSGTSFPDPRRAVVKSQKLRKGTFSCWECKRRKLRCNLRSLSGGPCGSCLLRGLTCITQDITAPGDATDDTVASRLGHVESLVATVIEQRSARRAHLQSRHQLKSGITGRHPSSLSVTSLPLPYSMDALSIHLYTILPDLSAVDSILRDSGSLQLPSQVRQLLRREKMTPSTPSDREGQITTPPSPTDNPIKFARKVVHLAMALQQLDATSKSNTFASKLSQPASEVMRQFISTVSRYITSQDNLVNTAEGLDLLLLEAVFQVNEGKVRAAWLLIRRGLAIAQMLGFSDRPGFHEQSLWFRFVYAERTLSLLLGLPIVVSEDSFSAEGFTLANTSAKRLDRIHASLIGRLVSRNLRLQRHRSSSQELLWQDDEYQETRSIDAEFKRAARLVSPSWWTCPSLNASLTEEELAIETADALTQMHHHYLLTVLHQPYLVKAFANPEYTYNQSVVPYSSREMLTRFLLLRGCYRGPTYRCLNDKAITTACALLLAHVHAHRLGPANVIEHQRPGDLALVERVVVSMDATASVYDDKVSRSYANMLRKLVEIEEKVSSGINYAVSLKDNECDAAEDEGRMNVPITYFGTINLICEKPRSPQLSEMTLGVFDNTFGMDDQLMTAAVPQSQMPTFSDLDFLSMPSYNRQDMLQPLSWAKGSDDLEGHCACKKYWS